MTSKEALENVIETLYDEWGYEGMKEEIKDILKPLYNDLDRLETLENAFNILVKELDIYFYTEDGVYDLTASFSSSIIDQEKAKVLKEAGIE